ncbi:DoxX family protein [Patescibacteria group bacterium]|nr:DoxX family protein [Patescibacteria group bacterium]
MKVLGSNPSRRTKAGEGRLMKYKSWFLLLLRLSLGWVFLYAGYSKLTVASGFTAKQFLLNLQGPFASFYIPLAGNPIVDNLVIWGELLIGLCLILGVLVRFASFWGIVMMLLFYFAEFPPEHSFIINDQLIYAFIFVYLMFSNAGNFWGFDKTLEKKFPKYKKLIG